MASREYQVRDRRLLDLVDLVYGGGVAYGADKSARRLVEIDANDANNVFVSGQSDVLPAAPTAVTMANMSNRNGATANIYDSEFLRGERIGRIHFPRVEWERDLTVFGQTFDAQRIPMDVDFNHYGMEWVFYFIAPQAGEYRFAFASNDGIRVWVNGAVVIAKWMSQEVDLTDADRQFRITLKKDQPLLFFVEFSDAKAIKGGIALHYGINKAATDFDATNDPIVPTEMLRAAYRFTERVDGEIPVDPGFVFEELMLYDGDNVDESAWTIDSGGFGTNDNQAFVGDRGLTIHDNTDYLFGSTFALSIMHRDVPVTQVALPFNLSAWLGGFEAQEDFSLIEVEWRDADDNILQTDALPTVSAADRGSLTGFLFKEVAGIIPAGTTYARVRATLTRLSGTNNDGYTDAILLKLGLNS